MWLISTLLLVILALSIQIVAHTDDIPPVRHYDFVKSSFKFNLDSIDLDLSAFNTTYTLKLKKNEGLIVADSVLHLHNQLTGEKTKHSIIAHPYQGVIVEKYSGLQQGTARILFHEDPFSTSPDKLLFDGSFTHPDGSFHINTVDNYRVSRRPGLDIDIVSPLSREDKHRAAHLILFKDVHKGHRRINSPDHMKPTYLSENYGCGYKPTKANADAIKNRQRRSGEGNRKLYKRQAVQSTCYLQERRALPMGVAADCSYVTSYGSPEKALKKIISNWNQASAIYEATFNIQLSIIEVKLLQGCGDVNGESLPWNRQCSEKFTINDRLSAFSHWRGAKEQDPAGLWHLMTKCNTGPSVGVAWLKQICERKVQEQASENGPQYVSGTGVSSIVPIEWKVVAHEIGHNFGAIHDCLGIQCPATCNEQDAANCDCCPCGDGSSCDCDGQFLMHPTDNSKQDVFSPCSIRLMCNGITQTETNCLVRPETLPPIQLGQCGNGVKEEGEECDCGKNCASNSCCDGNTCKFKNGAQCDDSVDACCDSCQLKSAGTICRESNDICTFTQICDDVSGVCPLSTTQPDGASCALEGAGGTSCASGVCTSRELQCQPLVTTGAFKIVGPCENTENQCKLLCETKSGTCLELNGNFIDGTPCIGGGRCRNGQCEGSNLISLTLYYFRTQPQIAIPIAVAIGLVLLVILFLFIRCCCNCCRNRKDRNEENSERKKGKGKKPAKQRRPSVNKVASRSRKNEHTNIYAPGIPPRTHPPKTAGSSSPPPRRTHKEPPRERNRNNAPKRERDRRPRNENRRPAEKPRTPEPKPSYGKWRPPSSADSRW